MPGTVAWNLQLQVQNGRLAAARELMSEMVTATEQEAGTIGYEWFLSPDSETCHTWERFADSGAVMEHLGNFEANFAERFLACFAPTSFFVYGQPSDEARGVLDGFGAVYLGPLGGFVR